MHKITVKFQDPKYNYTKETDWSKQLCEDYFVGYYFDVNSDGVLQLCVGIDWQEIT